ncbi:MAG: ATP-binding cassette domain-containing protein [Lachnospiraceae bacterium]|nr:ATP-binding cassette domain-containing protein [Lachnospiraceae bacterium]
MVLVEAKNYRFTYPEQPEPALDISDLTIEKGSFTLLTGESGSGKTTLLRQLAGEDMLQGNEEGELNKKYKSHAYVWQNPSAQIVTDRVAYEIVFGLENMGMEKPQMQRRLAEVVTFFGLEELLERDTMKLSGGEMQTLNVAAAIAMNPELLLLDEPFSQLDPVAVHRLLEFLRRINEELGITILIAEQRIEDILALADWMIIMSEGRIQIQGTPKEVLENWPKTDDLSYFPSFVRLYYELTEKNQVPLSAKEARRWFEDTFIPVNKEKEISKPKASGEKIVCRDIWFRYEKKMPDALRECSFEIPKKSITCLAGGNGSGKTTLLFVLYDRYKSYHGKIKNMPETCSLLPQQPEYLFLRDSVEEECRHISGAKELACRFGLEKLFSKNPADLSGGEKQRLGLALVLSKEAECFLLDEPTRGLDAAAKKVLTGVLQGLKQQGKTIFFVSHDMEFAAGCTDYMALMFQGKVELLTDTRSFFEENQFYTTGVNRICRGISKHIITQEDAHIYAKEKCD